MSLPSHFQEDIVLGKNGKNQNFAILRNGVSNHHRSQSDLYRIISDHNSEVFFEFQRLGQSGKQNQELDGNRGQDQDLAIFENEAPTNHETHIGLCRGVGDQNPKVRAKFQGLGSSGNQNQEKGGIRATNTSWAVFSRESPMRPEIEGGQIEEVGDLRESIFYGIESRMVGDWGFGVNS